MPWRCGSGFSRAWRSGMAMRWRCGSGFSRDWRSSLVTRFALAIALLFSAAAALAIDALPFADRHEERRFQMLVEELRCMVCQNQNLADSDAFLAKDLRREVFEMMRAGKSDTEIRDFLVQRYGDFVLYRPPVKPVTWALWFGPAAIVLGGLAGIVALIRRRARTVPAGATGEEDLP